MLQALKDQINAYFAKNPQPDGSYNSGYIYKRLFQYFKPYWFRALVATLITIPIGALDGAIAWSLKPYVDTMQVADSVQKISFVPFVIVGFTLIQGLLSYLSIYLNGWLGGRIMCDVRQDMFARLQTLDVSYFDRTPSGTIIFSYFQDPQSINTNILNNTKQMLTRMSSAIFLCGVLIMTSWKLSIIAISVLLLILYPSTLIRKIIKELAHRNKALTGNVLSYYTETVGGIRVIYGFNLVEQRLKKFREFQRNLFSTMMQGTKAQGWLTPSMHIIASIGIALIIWQGSTMVVSKELSTGGFVSFLAAMLMLYNPIKNLGGSILNAQMSLLVAGRIFQTMDQIPSIRNTEDARELTTIHDGIAFDHVYFSYDARAKSDDEAGGEATAAAAVAGSEAAATPEEAEEPAWVLEDVHLTFRKGETIALVGPSGGGKSTIVSLIPRYYDPNRGAIRIDGVDIRQYTLESLRRQIAIVTQDNFLFDGSIRENLLMGNPDATEAQLYAALEQAYLKDFVDTLPEGLETVIGERGVMLSGGQRQRVAIARAILKNAPIVILDEATSALDSKAEAVVQKAMESLMQNRTVVVIAHRLSTVRNADRIVVLEQGRVIEQGTHDVLLAANGAYASLYRTQYHTQQSDDNTASTTATTASLGS